MVPERRRRDGTRLRRRGARRAHAPGSGSIVTFARPDLVVPPWADKRRLSVTRRSIRPDVEVSDEEAAAWSSGPSRPAPTSSVPWRRPEPQRSSSACSQRSRVARLSSTRARYGTEPRSPAGSDGVDDDEQLGSVKPLSRRAARRSRRFIRSVPRSSLRPSRPRLTMRTKRGRRYWPCGWSRGHPDGESAAEIACRSRARRSAGGACSGVSSACSPSRAAVPRSTCAMNGLPWWWVCASAASTASSPTSSRELVGLHARRVEREVEEDLRAQVLADVDRDGRRARRPARGAVLDVLGTDAERDAPARVAAQRRPRGEHLRRHAELVRAEARDEPAVRARRAPPRRGSSPASR